MGAEFSHSIDDQNGIHFKISGDFDLECATGIKEQMKELLARKQLTAVDIDLKEVNYLDSSGLGTLIFIDKQLRAEGKRLILKNLSATVSRILELAALNTVFIIQQS